jgi:hypothetical protein
MIESDLEHPTGDTTIQTNDEERHSKSYENSYDLTPFRPDELETKEDNENTQRDSQDDEEQESQGEIKKGEEEGLLQGGSSAEQTARIVMYYTRIEDSDSEEEEKLEIDREEDDVDASRNAYSDLKDEKIEEENDKSSGFDEPETNGLSSLVESMQFSVSQSDVIQNVETVGEDGFPIVVEDDRTNDITSLDESPLSASSIPPTGCVEKKHSFSNAVPLLKPPSAEKMQAYLKSKGLVGSESNTQFSLSKKMEEAAVSKAIGECAIKSSQSHDGSDVDHSLETFATFD